MDQALLTEVFTRLADGFVTTLEIFALTLLISLPLGLIMSFGSMSKFLPLKYAVRFLVWVVRGSPLMIQLILVFYGPGLLGQWALDLVANGNTNAVIIWLSNIGVDHTEGCPCACHGSDDMLQRILWFFKWMISMMLKIEKNRMCECGIAHW